MGGGGVKWSRYFSSLLKLLSICIQNQNRRHQNGVRSSDFSFYHHWVIQRCVQFIVRAEILQESVFAYNFQPNIPTSNGQQRLREISRLCMTLWTEYILQHFLQRALPSLFSHMLSFCFSQICQHSFTSKIQTTCTPRHQDKAKHPTCLIISCTFLAFVAIRSATFQPLIS